ncbi:MAG: metallophosphoesterase, partial [Candidatus Bilamarchaeaceae archaeon]
ASIAAAAAGVFPSLANESESAKDRGFPDPSRHVFVVGDLHLTRKDPYSEMPILLDSLKSLSRGRKGFHIIFNGDLLEFPSMQEYCENGEWQWKQFLVLHSLLQSAGFITHVVLGNHDGDEGFARSLIGQAIPPENIGTSSFVFENGSRIILLSGMRPDKIDNKFLADELEKGEKGKTFVFSHFPPDSISSHIKWLNKRPGYGLIAWNREAIQAISKSGATLISSHIHSPFIGRYFSCLLEKPVNVVSTPSFSYDLPFFMPTPRGKRIFGITILDTSIRSGGALFFDKDKRFPAPKRNAKSYNGRYIPGDFSRKAVPGFRPNHFFKVSR